MLTIGISSYRKPELLRRCLKSIRHNTVQEYELFIVHNPGHDDGHDIQQILREEMDKGTRVVCMATNIGYAGAVNTFLRECKTEYLAYLDRDTEVRTRGWDKAMSETLDRHHEVGIVFPNGGPFPIRRVEYDEILWGCGFCWMLNRMATEDMAKHPSACGFAGLMDTEIGHQEEVDYCLRIRLAGWKIAALPSISVSHAATATVAPEEQLRINEGVRRWVTKWNRYFNGVGYDYHHTNVTRIDDWPPFALHLEQYWQQMFPGVNAPGWEPPSEHFDLGGFSYSWKHVPRRKDFYNGRVI